MAATKVFLADHDSQQRSTMTQWLVRAGYHVCGEAGDGNTVVGDYRGQSPDVVVLDLDLPHRSGLSILRGILEVDPRATVILITARRDAEAVTTALQLGVKGYLLKPLEHKRFIDLVHRVTGRRPVATRDDEVPQERQKRPGKPSVLVVEDQPVMRRVLRRVCEMAGCEVSAEAGSAVGGLAMFHQQRPDLVLLDIQLPDGSGLVLLRELRKIDREVPIIMTTVESRQHVVHKAIREGANAYLVKPLDPEHAATVIRTMLRPLRGKASAQGRRKPTDEQPQAGEQTA